MSALGRTFCLMVVLGCVGVSVEAQNATTGTRDKELTITAAGEAVGAPDTMYVRLISEATAGNASDAFDQTKNKADAACKAIDVLGIDGAEIIRLAYEFGSPSSANPYVAMQQTAVPAGTRVSQVIKVKIPLGVPVDLEDLSRTTAKVLDAANKVGVGFATDASLQAQMMGGLGEPPVKYVLEDAAALRTRAMKDAVAKAMRIRKGMSDAGVVSGRLRSVQYGSVASPFGVFAWPQLPQSAEEEQVESASSASPQKVVLQSTVTLSFELQEE